MDSTKGAEEKSVLLFLAIWHKMGYGNTNVVYSGISSRAESEKSRVVMGRLELASLSLCF